MSYQVVEPKVVTVAVKSVLVKLASDVHDVDPSDIHYV
jgi:hypothetical protein